jgi:DNA-binding HxlR family transcriptional regulator
MACSLEARVLLKIAPGVLSRELKTLAQTGTIERRDYKVAPPKVEYKLTATGNPAHD